jgi:predicted nucleic acid-binding protein
MDPTTEAYIVDASVAVKWYLSGEVLGTNADLIFSRFERNEVTLIAPAHIHCEVPSAIVAATRGNSARFSREQGRLAIDEFLSLDLHTVPSKELTLHAYDLVHEYDVSIYDALYLALALDYSIPLVTADSKFYQRVEDLPEVIWLGDIADD